MVNENYIANSGRVLPGPPGPSQAVPRVRGGRGVLPNRFWGRSGVVDLVGPAQKKIMPHLEIYFSGFGVRSIWTGNSQGPPKA